VRLPGLAVTLTLAGWRLAVTLTLVVALAITLARAVALPLAITLARAITLTLPLVVALTWRRVVALAGPRLHGFLTLSPVVRIGKTHNNHASLSCYCKPDSTTRPRTDSSTEHQSCTNRY